MKKQTKLIMAIAATAAIATIGTIALVKAPALNNFAQVKASTKSVTLNAEDLSKATFSDLDLVYETKHQYDKQFQIPLEDGKYINGALVYSDCGHQFAGNNLSETFGLDNSGEASGNAFNFNFLFSFENNVTDASVNFTVVDTLNATSKSYAYRLRFSYKADDDSSLFYTRIKDNWDGITTYGSSFYNGDYEAYTAELSSTKESKSISGDKGSHNHNTIVNFNFNSQDLVPAGDVVTFQITSISFTYECK